MKTRSRKNSRGYTEWSFTKILFLLLVIIGIFFGIEAARAYYDSVQVKSAMKTALYRNKTETNDEALADILLQAMKISPSIQVDPKTLSIARSSDGKRIVINVTYSYNIHIPFVEKDWTLQFSPSLDEDLANTLL